MKCPHCTIAFFPAWANPSNLGQDDSYLFQAREARCPSCNKNIIQLGKATPGIWNWVWSFVYPKSSARPPIPTEVQDDALVASYTQSCLVLADSPMASAALSRRALQHILREKAAVRIADLSAEIDEVISSGKLPTELEGSLDAVRLIGNFAAHPMKSTNSGEVLEVEPGEAEWNLDVVEALMDYYYVRPAQAKAKKAALNIKLREAGKPELPL